MAVTTTNVTVLGSATLLAGGAGTVESPTPVTVYNNGVATIFIGGTAVTSSNGIPLAAGAQKDFSITDGNALYAVVATATQTVSVMKAWQ